jgi:PadR family transcriptional regulator PadR
MSKREPQANPEGSSSSSTFPQKGEIQARPRNWLEPAILLMLREWNSYGYKLMEQLTVLGFEAMNPGTMYRTLRKMENDGVVKSKWETSGDGPARRTYSVTEAGEAYLEFWVKSLEHYQRSVDAFLSLYTNGSKRRKAVKKDG